MFRTTHLFALACVVLLHGLATNSPGLSSTFTHKSLWSTAIASRSLLGDDSSARTDVSPSGHVDKVTLFPLTVEVTSGFEATTAPHGGNDMVSRSLCICNRPESGADTLSLLQKEMTHNCPNCRYCCDKKGQQCKDSMWGKGRNCCDENGKNCV